MGPAKAPYQPNCQDTEGDGRGRATEKNGGIASKKRIQPLVFLAQVLPRKEGTEKDNLLLHKILMRLAKALYQTNCQDTEGRGERERQKKGGYRLQKTNKKKGDRTKINFWGRSIIGTHPFARFR